MYPPGGLWYKDSKSGAETMARMPEARPVRAGA